MGSSPVTGILLKRGQFRQLEGRQPSGGAGRDRNDAAKAEDCRQPPRARRNKENTSLEPLEGAWCLEF